MESRGCACSFYSLCVYKYPLKGKFMKLEELTSYQKRVTNKLKNLFTYKRLTCTKRGSKTRLRFSFMMFARNVSLLKAEFDKKCSEISQACKSLGIKNHREGKFRFYRNGYYYIYLPPFDPDWEGYRDKDLSRMLDNVKYPVDTLLISSIADRIEELGGDPELIALLRNPRQALLAVLSIARSRGTS